MDTRAHFASNLRRLRKRRELSQDELATRIGRSKEAISQLERSKSSPSLETLVLLQRVLEVPLDELVEVAKADDYADPERHRLLTDLLSLTVKMDNRQIGVLLQTGKALLDT